MTKEEIELIADRVADKVIERLKESGMFGVYQDPIGRNVALDGLEGCVARAEENAKKRWKERFYRRMIGGINESALSDVDRAELFNKQQQLQRMRDRIKDGWQTLRQEKYE
jgi:ATP-dependent helicase/DNAse subunit B